MRGEPYQSLRSSLTPAAGRLRTLAAGALAALLAAASPTSSRAQGAPPPAQDSVYRVRLDSAYAALRSGDTTAAIGLLEGAVVRAPRETTARIQLAYVLLARGRRREAAARLEEALMRDPARDDARRQLGYTLAEIGRTGEARDAFRYLRDARRATVADLVALGNLETALGERADADVAFREAVALADAANDADGARRARAGLLALARTGGGAGTFAELYAAPFYQERFDNTTALGFVRGGVRGGGPLRPSLYLSVRATRDSRSTGGLQPVLFNDNTVIPAVGARVDAGNSGLSLYGEAGAAYRLVGAGTGADSERWKRDLRGGVTFVFAREHVFTSTRAPFLLTEIAGDASYYSRFDDNVIAYGQLRESLRLLRRGAFAFDVNGRLWGATDRNGDYYNRVGEAGGGIAFHVGRGTARASLYLDAIRGRYLERPPAPAAQGYDDFRATLVLGAFAFRPFASGAR